MSDRIILHCDLNSFFASVSLLLNPTLYNLPVAVCGNAEDRHGIVLAKNDIAKSYGVKTAEAIWEARSKCPELVTLPPDYKKYIEYSRAVRRIYERYTDLIEPFGIDECWLDVTGSTLLFGDGEQMANRIRREVKRELGITISVGVSFNKTFAKLGSDMKKPDAVTVISRENFKNTVWPLPASDLLFVGKSTAERLKTSGIFTVGDLTVCDDAVLKRILGKSGIMLKRYALGEDFSAVCPPSDDDKPKSVGHSITGKKDLCCNDEVWRVFLTVGERIASQLREKNLRAAGIQVHTRNSSLEVQEFSKTYSVPSNTSVTLSKRAMELFSANYRWQLPLRTAGFRAIGLKPCDCGIQQDIFGEADIDFSAEKLESSVDALRVRFGRDSIKRGTTIPIDSGE